MRPHEFVRYLGEMVDRLDFPREDLILGGDHLGPEVWQAESSETAMDKARVLVRDYIKAGYLKIHLDASMQLGDDPDGPLSSETAAGRAADLAWVAEDAYNHGSIGAAPRYVIGTEVPVPGGAREKESHLHVTRVTDAAETIDSTRQAFYQKGLESAWERVIALVVSPVWSLGMISSWTMIHMLLQICQPLSKAQIWSTRRTQQITRHPMRFTRWWQTIMPS